MNIHKAGCLIWNKVKQNHISHVQARVEQVAEYTTTPNLCSRPVHPPKFMHITGY